jgi:hypothetical protein
MKLSILFLFCTNLLFSQSWLQNPELSLGFSFNHFQQQIKTEIGGKQGDKLVENTSITFTLNGLVSIYKGLKAGIYLDYESGSRKSGRFQSFSSENAAITDQKNGGSFTEIWIGPIIQFNYHQAFIEFAHGTFAIRKDDGRVDIPDNQNDNKSSFKAVSSVAWKLQFGYKINLSEKLDSFIKIQYRVRYYDRRDGTLKNNYVLGSQNITPVIGLSYSL